MIEQIVSFVLGLGTLWLILTAIPGLCETDHFGSRQRKVQRKLRTK